VRRGALLLCVLWAAGCGTVDPGDNFITPEVMVDDEYFYCEIQPNVITRNTCASGGAGEAGSCHTTRSALRLLAAAEMATAPACTDGRVNDPTTIPVEYMTNFDRVQFTVQSSLDRSPFYRRPVGIDSHPRQVFAPGSMEEMLIEEWLLRGSL
jgi:hypothetical protein